MRVRKWLTLMMALALALSLLIPVSAGTVAATDPLPGSGELVSKTATFTITEDPAERFMIGNDVVAKFHISVESGDATPIRAFSFCLEATGLTLADDVAANNAQFYYAYPTLNDLQAMYTKVEYTPGTKYFACGGSAETGITNTAKEVLMIMAKVTGDGEHKLSIVTKDTTDPSRVVVAGQSEGTTADQFIRVVNNWALDYANATVSGKVLDGKNSGNLAGATVKLMQGTTEKANTTTDAEGNYSFADVAPGSYSVVVNKGDLNGSGTVNVLGANVNVANITAVDFQKGDVDKDGVVGAASDISALKQHFVGNTLLSADQVALGDFNGNGMIDASDISLLKQYYVGNINSLD